MILTFQLIFYHKNKWLKIYLKTLPFIIGTIVSGADNEKRLAATGDASVYFSTDFSEIVAAQAEEVFAGRTAIRTVEQELQNAHVLHHYLTGEQEFLNNYHLNGLTLHEATLDQVNTLIAVIAQADAIIEEHNLVINHNKNDITAAEKVIKEYQNKLDTQPYGWYSISYTNEQNEERQIWEGIIATQREIIANANQNIVNANEEIREQNDMIRPVALGEEEVKDNLESLRIRLRIMNGENPMEDRLALVNHHLAPLEALEQALKKARAAAINEQTEAASAHADYMRGDNNLIQYLMNSPDWTHLINYQKLEEEFKSIEDRLNQLRRERASLENEIAHYNRYEGGRLNAQQEEELAGAARDMDHLPQKIAQLNENHLDLTIYQQGGIDALREGNLVAEELINILALRPNGQINGVTINDLAGFQNLLTQNFQNPNTGVIATVNNLIDSVLGGWLF